MSNKNLVRCGLVSALIAVSSWISVPFSVPFTMQTFGVFCALLILGGKLGTISTSIYVLLGAVGLPVFAGFHGGIGVIFSPLGGFIIGFIIIGIVYTLITDLFGIKPTVQIAALITGLITCYITGIIWYMFFSTADLKTALFSCIVPFIIPDGIKLWLAFYLSRQLKTAALSADKKTT